MGKVAGGSGTNNSAGCIYSGPSSSKSEREVLDSPSFSPCIVSFPLDRADDGPGEDAADLVGCTGVFGDPFE
jgi:hypothetical protein